MLVPRALPRKNTKVEAGRKFLISGFLGMRCASGSMCGMSLAAPLPLRRLQSWHQAFMHKNKDKGAIVVVVVVVSSSSSVSSSSCLWWLLLSS